MGGGRVQIGADDTKGCDIEFTCGRNSFIMEGPQLFIGLLWLISFLCSEGLDGVTRVKLSP